MILVPFFHFSEDLFSPIVFVCKTLLAKDTFKESSISTEEFLHTPSVSLLLLQQQPQCMLVPLLQAGNSKCQSSVEKKPKSLFLMEFVPLILMMKSKLDIYLQDQRDIWNYNLQLCHQKPPNAGNQLFRTLWNVPLYVPSYVVHSAPLGTQHYSRWQIIYTCLMQKTLSIHLTQKSHVFAFTEKQRLLHKCV